MKAAYHFIPSFHWKLKWKNITSSRKERFQKGSSVIYKKKISMMDRR